MREVVGRRLSNLEPAVNDVLVVASVIGRDFDVAMLAAVCDGGEEAVLDALEAAEARGLVTPVTGRAAQYRFAHALVRSTLYDELTTSRRLRLHRSVARALVGRPDAETRLPELARHFSECAALGEIDRAVEYCRRAGNAAREELAFEEAADYYERSLGALELADQPDAALRADLLVAAGVALVTIGDSRGRELLYEAARLAREIGDAARLADAAIELQLDTHTREVTAVDEKLVALLDEALDALDVDDFERRALLLSGLTAELMWTEDSPRRERLSGEALATARRAGTPRVVGRALFIQQFGYDHTSLDMDRYSAEGAEMIELARAVDDPILLSWGYYHRIVGSFYRGDRAQLDIDIDASLELTARLRQPALEARALVQRTARTLLSGDLDTAEREIAEIDEYGRTHGVAVGARSARSPSGCTPSAVVSPSSRTCSCSWCATNLRSWPGGSHCSPPTPRPTGPRPVVNTSGSSAPTTSRWCRATISGSSRSPESRARPRSSASSTSRHAPTTS